MRPRLVITFAVTLVSACGGSESDPCAPNGALHGEVHSPSAHCDCNAGFVADGLTCVAQGARDGGVAPRDGGTAPDNVDCGPNGTFDGRVCNCDAGYTQSGLGENITCEAIPACLGQDDVHEANDTAGAGKLIPPGQGDYHACPANLDWYLVSLRADDVMEVTLDFDGSAVDLDLFLFGPSSGNPQAVSVGTSSRESAQFVAQQSGTGAILVSPYGTGEGSYRMSVDIRPSQMTMCSPPGGSCGGNADCCSNDCHLGHCH